MRHHEEEEIEEEKEEEGTSAGWNPFASLVEYKQQ